VGTAETTTAAVKPLH